MPEPLLTRYMLPLLAGRRAECFALARGAVMDGWSAESVLRSVVWPSLAQLERLYRDDRVNLAVKQMAVRINRTVADQMQAHLTHAPRRDRRIIVTSADGEPEELGAQIVADLFQADGWDVYLLGGGVPADEILTLVGNVRPHVLLIFGTRPEGVPGVRSLVQMIREIGVGQTMNIIVSGGIYDRADELWKEVGADICVPTAEQAIDAANHTPPRVAGTIPMGIVKKRRRRRRTETAATRPHPVPALVAALPRRQEPLPRV